MRWVFYYWNLLLTTLVGVLLFQSTTQNLDLMESNLRVATLTRTLEAIELDVSSLREGTRATVGALDLLSDQCELTLDILVSANRGGWWSNTVLHTRMQLQQLKQERTILNGLLN